MDYTTPFSLVMHDRQYQSNTLNNIGYLYTYYTTVSVSELCLLYKSLMYVFLKVANESISYCEYNIFVQIWLGLGLLNNFFKR